MLTLKATATVKKYVLDQRQRVDTWWLCDYVQDDVRYELVFRDSTFSLACVNILAFDSEYLVIDRTLPKKEGEQIYKMFVESLK